MRAEIDLAEVRDATSFCELHQCEMLGFCPAGEDGPFDEATCSIIILEATAQ